MDIQKIKLIVTKSIDWLKKWGWAVLPGISMIIFAISIITCHYGVQSIKNKYNYKDTVVYDTTNVTNPIPKDSTVLCYRSVKLPIQSKDSTGNIRIEKESVSVSIPIVQKEYSDSSYHAWISGYEAKLDSIKVVNKSRVITNTVTVVKKHHFGIGIQLGATYKNSNVTNWKDNVSPYVGIGISYNILTW